MSPVRVFLADDHPMILAGIRSLLEAEADMQVVGEACDGQIALQAVMALRPDVAVLDISMPGLSGVELAAALCTDCPGCRVVILTAHEDRSYVRRLLEIGIAGYVLKRSAATELMRAIRVAMRGGAHLDPEIAGHVVRRQPALVIAEAARGEEPSEREMEVLRLTAAGHSNKEVASALSISVKTVDVHKAQGMRKLGFTSRVQLLRHALRMGWLE